MSCVLSVMSFQTVLRRCVCYSLLGMQTASNASKILVFLSLKSEERGAVGFYVRLSESKLRSVNEEE